jgi:hypothetical protein
MAEIKIACTGAGLEDYRNLVDLQDNLKERTEEDITNAVASILKHGWSFPFFVWKNMGQNYVLDGHGRLKALAELESKGYSIPPLPSAYIFADDMQEAKIKLLKVNARYGSLTQAGYALFTSDMGSIDLDGVSIKFDIPQKIKVDTTDYTEGFEAIDKFGEVEINIACPECMEESAFTVKELLELMGA